MARHRAAPSRSKRLRTGIIAVVVLALVAVIGFAVFEYVGLKKDLNTSDALQGNTPSGTVSAKPTKELNLLIMGLDSRVDVKGNPLPKDIYDALHAGDQTDGGLNANVLMLLHIPVTGKAVEISIPRDDEVALHGCPDQECTGKIKQAYGLAVDQEQRRLSGTAGSGMSAAQKYQKARDAGRLAQVQTVQDFLQVRIDHFVEVTMVAFFQLAQVVAPIKVCLLNDTVDTYSGANFKKGTQELDASQALAFVRQRRDTKNASLEFTDLDRSRRQQAFITSVATQLKNVGTLTNPLKINDILEVVKQNTAIDSGLDLLSFLGQAREMAGGNVNYYTLPVKAFGTNSRGEDVNIVDLEQVRATTKLLLEGRTPGEATAKPTGSATSRPTTSSGTPTTAPSATATAKPPVSAGSNPKPTDLSQLEGGGVPCVK